MPKPLKASSTGAQRATPCPAKRTLGGYESMNMIRKRQIKGADKKDVIGQIAFLDEILGVAA